MGVTDVMLLVIRWLHAMAAVAWVGGGIFYLLVLRPALGGRNGEPAEATLRVGEQFRHLVNTAIAVLLVTGAVLTLSRLTSDYVGIPYIAVLSAKIALAVYMFYLVRFLRPRTYVEQPGAASGPLERLAKLSTGAMAVLVLGVIVILLSDILRSLVEHELEG